MKSVCSFTRKQGMSRAAFQRYYEERHAPLGLAHFPFSGYVRNHVLSGQRSAFETITEFWADDLTRLSALLDGPVGPIMAADEARFMEREKTAPAVVTEELTFSAGAPADADGLRWVALLDWSADTVPAGLHLWAQEVAHQQPGVSLDVLRPWAGVSFPARALLWVPNFAAAPPSPSELTVRGLRVRRVRTPDSELLPQESQRSAT